MKKPGFSIPQLLRLFQKPEVEEPIAELSQRWPLQMRQFNLGNGETHEFGTRKQAEIFFVMRGETDHETGGTSLALREGSVVFAQPGNRQTLTKYRNLQILRLRFLPEWLADEFQKIVRSDDLMSLAFAAPWLGKKKGSSVFTFTLDEERRDAVRSDLAVLEEAALSGKIDGLLAKVTFFKLLLHIGEQFGNFWREKNRYKLDRELVNALLWIETAVRNGRSLGIHELESVLGIEPAAIRKIFKSETGRDPVDYIESRRAAHAARHFLNGDSPKKVIERLGYGSNTALEKGFKLCFGISPEAYRTKFCGAKREKSDAGASKK